MTHTNTEIPTHTHPQKRTLPLSNSYEQQKKAHTNMKTLKNTHSDVLKHTQTDAHMQTKSI